MKRRKVITRKDMVKRLRSDLRVAARCRADGKNEECVAFRGEALDVVMMMFRFDMISVRWYSYLTKIIYDA